ncbi:hypothetical protein C8R45DRAFT_1135938 [Mycena sanguinolenta]|nr:hypothetical protein C8R45DRAFT_1135938 [Mycena sanguinolenta]
MSDVGKLTIPLVDAEPPRGGLIFIQFVGTVVNWGLLGALAVQVYIYCLAFPKDRLVSKLVVAFVVIAETLQTIGGSRDTIRIFGAGWGNPEILNEVGWAWFSVPILGSLIASVGQIFFAWRIYIIAKSPYVPILIAIVTAFQLGAGIWTGVDIIRARVFSQFRLFIPPEAWLSATAASDFIIVGGMVFYLLKAKQPEFKAKTNATLSRIIKFTVETGALCALSAIADLCLFVAFDGNNYHLGVCIWLSKVYSNSILVILNSRAHIGHDVVPQGGTDLMTGMTEVVFHNYKDPVSTTQGSVQASTIADDSDSNFVHAIDVPRRAHVME